MKMMMRMQDGGEREEVCFYCKGIYDDDQRKPKMLRCYHTFCRYVTMLVLS